jgi:hypothetical protein
VGQYVGVMVGVDVCVAVNVLVGDRLGVGVAFLVGEGSEVMVTVEVWVRVLVTVGNSVGSSGRIVSSPLHPLAYKPRQTTIAIMFESLNIVFIEYLNQWLFIMIHTITQILSVDPLREIGRHPIYCFPWHITPIIKRPCQEHICISLRVSFIGIHLPVQKCRGPSVGSKDDRSMINKSLRHPSPWEASMHCVGEKVP